MVVTPQEILVLTTEEKNLKKQLDGIIEHTLRNDPVRSTKIRNYGITVDVSTEQFPMIVIMAVKADYEEVGWDVEFEPDGQRDESAYLRFKVAQKPSPAGHWRDR